MKKNTKKNIKAYIKKNSSPEVLLNYLSFAPEDILESIDHILGLWTPGPGALKELLELAIDIKIKTKKNPLSDQNLLDIVKNSGLKELIKNLQGIRYPKLTQLRTKLKNEIKKNTNENISINFDQSFEDDTLNLVISLKSKDSIMALKKDLNKLIATGKLEEILETYLEGLE